MKILTVVGARPQFIKAAVLSRELAKRSLVECLVHTGQHYDFEMSDVFFNQLGLRDPDHYLGVGSASHAVQTGEIMKRLEPVVLTEKPDFILVYGDTNTTLAGALVASKLQVPLAHVEAGLRSFNRAMPEEINRIVTDHVSNLLLAPTENAAINLKREGLALNTHVVGDLMVDLVLAVAKSTESLHPILHRFELIERQYALATVHRPSNADDEKALGNILHGLTRLPFPVIFPVHPRTAPHVSSFGTKLNNVLFCEPIPYREMVALQKNARVIITDSGGIQKEAFALGVPCVTLRDETEWIETLEFGWNVLVGNDPQRIEMAAQREAPVGRGARVFGEGDAAKRIADLLSRDEVPKHTEAGLVQRASKSSKLGSELSST